MDVRIIVKCKRQKKIKRTNNIQVRLRQRVQKRVDILIFVPPFVAVHTSREIIKYLVWTLYVSTLQ